MSQLLHPLYCILTLLLFACKTSIQNEVLNDPILPVTNVLEDGPATPDPEDFAKRIQQAFSYCKQNGLDTRVAILVDLGLHSGKNRCVVVSLANGKIQAQGLVTHGSGHAGLGVGEREYSNKNGSYLSALGMYKTGIAYHGQFGLAYKLHGLNSSNSNAFGRSIVLHGHECVPDYELNDLLCQSWGCPTVSPAFLKKLQKVIDSSDKPILLWIYDSVSGRL